MEEKVVKKPKRSKTDIIIAIALFIYLMIDTFIRPESVDGVLPLWYQLLNWSIDLIWVILAYFSAKRYCKTLKTEKTFKNEEEVREYYNNSQEGKKNKTTIIVSLILTIIFIAATVTLAKMNVKQIIESICEFAAVIAAIIFAASLGEKSGTLKALKSKIK